MKMANLSLLILVVVNVAIIVLVIIGIRNSIVSTRNNEMIRQDGVETFALIVDAVQHKNQNIEGQLSLNLTVEFTDGEKKIVAHKDVIVKIFEADNFTQE